MATESDTKDAVERFSRERLMAEAQSFLGVEPYVLAGALANSTKESFTVTEARSLCDKFLKAEVASA